MARERCRDYTAIRISARGSGVPLISSLSRREQIRYMRLLCGIARALGAAPFGSTAQLLAAVHQAARAHSIDTPGSFPGHDTDMADRWLPDLSDLADMALQVNMRMGSHTVSRSMSPTRSVTPPGGPSRSGRPQAHDTSGKREGHPSCVMQGCPCTSTFNGEPGEACCRTCQQGVPCASNYHPHPMGRGRQHGRRVPGRTDLDALVTSRFWVEKARRKRQNKKRF